MPDCYSCGGSICDCIQLANGNKIARTMEPAFNTLQAAFNQEGSSKTTEKAEKKPVLTDEVFNRIVELACDYSRERYRAHLLSTPGDGYQPSSKDLETSREASRLAENIKNQLKELIHRSIR